MTFRFTVERLPDTLTFEVIDATTQSRVGEVYTDRAVAQHVAADLNKATAGARITKQQAFLDAIVDLPLGFVERTRFGGLALVPLTGESLDHLFNALAHHARRGGLRLRRGAAVWTVTGFPKDTDAK